MRDTPYATEIRSAEVNECRIERIHVKALNREEIRFSWWPEGRMAARPLDLPENELLTLMCAATNAGVFSDEFVTRLKRELGERLEK